MGASPNILVTQLQDTWGPAWSLLKVLEDTWQHLCPLGPAGEATPYTGRSLSSGSGLPSQVQGSVPAERSGWRAAVHLVGRVLRSFLKGPGCVTEGRDRCFGASGQMSVCWIQNTSAHVDQTRR